MSKGPGKAHREGITLAQLTRKFPDEQAATKWFESIVWGGDRCCGHCGSLEMELTRFSGHFQSKVSRGSPRCQGRIRRTHGSLGNRWWRWCGRGGSRRTTGSRRAIRPARSGFVPAPRYNLLRLMLLSVLSRKRMAS